MPSSGSSLDALARRVARLEAAIPTDQRPRWRAYLARVFAASEYDDQRDTLIEQLVADGAPCPQAECYIGDTWRLFFWPERAQGRPIIEVVMAAEVARAMFAEEEATPEPPAEPADAL